MEPISFIELKSFLLKTLREFTIHDYIFRKHGYFIYDDNDKPKLNHIKIFEKIQLKFNIRDYSLEEKLLISYLESKGLLKTNIEGERVNADKYDSDRNINGDYLSLDSLVTSVSNTYINSDNRIHKYEIDKILTSDLDYIDKWININRSLIKNGNSKFVIENEDVALVFVVKVFKCQDFIRNSNTHYDYSKMDSELLQEIYPSHEFVKTLEWKMPMLKALSCDIPSPCYYSQSRSNRCVFGYHKVSDQPIYPIWKALKTAIINNEIIKDTSNYFYLNFNNGIYARMCVSVNDTVISELTLALKCHIDGTFGSIKAKTEVYLFCGDHRSGYIIPKGMLLNYREWIFDITFDADSMLLQNDISNHLLQSVFVEE